MVSDRGLSAVGHGHCFLKGHCGGSFCAKFLREENLKFYIILPSLRWMPGDITKTFNNKAYYSLGLIIKRVKKKKNSNHSNSTNH